MPPFSPLLGLLCLLAPFAVVLTVWLAHHLYRLARGGGEPEGPEETGLDRIWFPPKHADLLAALRKKS